MNDIVLASASIGRKRLFTKYFKHYKVSVSNIDETKIKIDEPIELAKRLAFLKATAVSKYYHNDFVLGFDTIVVCEDRLIGKPKTKPEAFEMLRFLSGKEQRVISGYAIINTDAKIEINGFDETDLFFKDLSDNFISEYIEKHPVMNYAGGYAIQDNDEFIRITNGDFENVIGAPMKKVIAHIRKYLNDELLLIEDSKAG